VTHTIFGSTVGYSSDSLASCWFNVASGAQCDLCLRYINTLTYLLTFSHSRLLLCSEYK